MGKEPFKETEAEDKSMNSICHESKSFIGTKIKKEGDGNHSAKVCGSVMRFLKFMFKRYCGSSDHNVFV